MLAFDWNQPFGKWRDRYGGELGSGWMMIIASKQLVIRLSLGLQCVSLLSGKKGFTAETFCRCSSKRFWLIVLRFPFYTIWTVEVFGWSFFILSLGQHEKYSLCWTFSRVGPLLANLLDWWAFTGSRSSKGICPLSANKWKRFSWRRPGYSKAES